ncbi:MAG TPA: SRPBCC family protein [Candidatus Lokiarchaeia archaeon]|nr:SRPBCC family protein [Candidatus Lokiarchaeia archaeon]
MERVFNAPRDLVFKAHTDPNLVPRWWGPSRLTTTIDQIDLQPGGSWRFVQRDAENNEYAFHGEYRQVGPPEYIEYTFEFERMPGHVLVESVTFEDLEGKTKVTAMDAYETLEDLNGMFQTGMLEGSTESMDRFADILQELQAE